MPSGLTNIGKIRILEMALRNTGDTASMDASPYFVALMTSVALLADTYTTFDTTLEIVPDAGGGYVTGGQGVARDTTDFDSLSVGSDSAHGFIRFKDIAWTASGGNMPASGDGAFYAVLLDDNATVGSRQVYAYWDLTEGRTIGSGAVLTLQDMEIRLT